MIQLTYELAILLAMFFFSIGFGLCTKLHDSIIQKWEKRCDDLMKKNYELFHKIQALKKIHDFEFSSWCETLKGFSSLKAK